MYREIPISDAEVGDCIQWTAMGGIGMRKQIEGQDGERFAMSGGWSHMHPDHLPAGAVALRPIWRDSQ